MREFKYYVSKANTALLMILIALPMWAQSPGNVTLQLKDTPLLQALQLIKQQAEVKFIYSDEELRHATPVTAELDNVSVQTALNLVLLKQPYTYEQSEGNVFVIKPLSTPPHDNSGNQRALTGKIVDAKTGDPLIGASILDRKSQKGTVSGLDGTFSLTIPNGTKHLTVSYVGYDMKTTPVSGSVLVIALGESKQSLNELVVVGYGSTHRKDLTGSVATVKTEELQNLPALTIDDALAGKAAGVQVTKADGSPGGAVRIRVRGGSSLRGSVDPLYIIDGIPTEIKNNYISSTEIVNPLEAANYGEDFGNSVSGSFMRGLNSLAGLSISDIESISILKDASATAIYGSKAANGVVIITTKKGRRDMKPQFNFNYNISVANPVKEKLLNGEQYLSALKSAIESSNKRLEANFQVGNPDLTNYLAKNSKIWQEASSVGNANTDWLDLILQTGISHNADFSVAGGGKSSRYYTSLSYSKQDGTLISTAFERYAGKISVDNDLTEKFRMGTNLSFGYTKNNITNGVYSQAMSAPPVLPAYNPDGTYANFAKLGTLASSYMGFQNPVAVASGTNEAKTYTFNGSMYGELDIISGLKFKSMISVSYENYNQLNYIPSYVKMSGYYGVSSSEGGQGSQAQSTATGLFFENTLTYNKVFNENHRIDAVIGTSWEEQKSNFFSASGKGYPDDKFLNNLSSAQTAGNVQGANPATQNSLLSFYLRANYVLKDRYLFTFTGRSDNSSKFAKKHRVGYFPSGAIAWRISEEPFLKSVHWIDEIKLRASIGKTGTQSIADHMFRTLYNVGAYGGGSALYPAQLGNDEIKWESTVQKDLGLDFSFLKGRLSGTLAYYHKITDGALLSITPAPSSGYTSLTANFAKIKNIGVEFELNSELIRTKDWRWNLGFNISHNSSKVLKLNGDNFSSDDARGELNLGTTIYREGESLGLLCGYRVLGLIQNQEQLDDYKNRFSMWPYFYADMGIGSPELALDERGMYYQDVIGNCTPDFYGGINTQLSYKNWSLMAQFTYSYGNELIYQKNVTDQVFNSLANRGTSILGSSTADRFTGQMLSAYQSLNFLTNLNVYDASYLKLQSLSLSYALPSKAYKKLGLNNLSFYATASNLFTLTSYPGPDPAVSDDPYSVAGGGRDVSSYPTVRSYTFGIRLGF